MGLYSGHNLRTEIWTGFGILLFLLEPSGIININMQIILQNDNIQVISKVFKMPNIVIKVICRVYAKFGILTWNKHKTIQRYENDGVGLFKDAWGQRKSNLILCLYLHILTWLIQIKRGLILYVVITANSGMDSQGSCVNLLSSWKISFF